MHIVISALQRMSSLPQFAAKPCEELGSTWPLAASAECPAPRVGAGAAKPRVLPTEKPPQQHFSLKPKGGDSAGWEVFRGRTSITLGLGHLLGITALRTGQTRRLPTLGLVLAQRAGGAGSGVGARASRTARAAPGA